MLDKCIEVINALGSATVRELREHLGLVDVTARKYMRSLYESKRVYVFDHVWIEGCKQRVPLFKVGNLPDEPIEVLQEPTHVVREDLEGEALAKIDANKKHEAWAKQWTPHRDIAASWI